MFEGSLERGVRCRTVGRLMSSYKPLIVRGLVGRRKTKRCLVQEHTWIHARHSIFCGEGDAGTGICDVNSNR
jgi:hypothetical protein